MTRALGIPRLNLVGYGVCNEEHRAPRRTIAIGCLRIQGRYTEMAHEFCRTPEDYKAWSQNLGHADVLTTFTSYGSVAPARHQLSRDGDVDK